MKTGMTIAIACIATLLLPACRDSNPLIGKWTAAKGQADCDQISIVFTEKDMRVLAPTVPDQAVAVVYSRDGSRYVAIAQVGDKKAYVFEKTSDGLTAEQPVKCRFVKAAS